MIGQTISQYKILEIRGIGGMGVLCESRDTKLRRDKVFKFPEGEGYNNRGQRPRSRGNHIIYLP